MVPAVAKNENGVVTTSSPGFKSSAFRGRSSASVPLAHAMPCFAWASPAMAVSSRGTLGAITNCRDSITAWSAGRTSSLIARYGATRSRSGTFTTSVSESRATKLSDAAGLGNRAQGAVRLLVAGATDGAGRLARRQGEAFAALAHPADAARRHAYHERVRRNVGSHDGAPPMNAYSPRVTPHTIVAFAPMDEPRLTSVGRYSCLRDTWLRGFITLVKTHDGPQNTSSSRVTPS